MFKLRLDEEVIGRIRISVPLEIYLVKSEVSSLQETIICNHLFLKNTSLFRIEGVVEDFGIKRDEVFGIAIKNGWVRVNTRRGSNKTSIVIGEEYHGEPNDLNELVLYKKILPTNLLGIQILTTVEDLVDIGTKKEYHVEVDKGVLLKGDNKSVYIGQHIFPYSLIVTSDEQRIEEIFKQYGRILK